LFGGLSVWAMIEFAAGMSGIVAASGFFVLLTLSAVQSWYSRFLMPEIPAQFFVWGGLSCLSFWDVSRRRADAVLAGLGFGIAGLMRIENAGFLLVALLLSLWIGDRESRVDRFWLFACAAAVWVHAAAHLIFFRTHYLGILFSFYPEIAAAFSAASRVQIVVLVTAVAALLLWLYRRGVSLHRGIAPVVALAAGVALWVGWRQGWAGLTLLADYTGIPTLVAGGAGLALWVLQAKRSNL